MDLQGCHFDAQRDGVSFKKKNFFFFYIILFRFFCSLLNSKFNKSRSSEAAALVTMMTTFSFVSSYQVTFVRVRFVRVKMTGSCCAVAADAWSQWYQTLSRDGEEARGSNNVS